MQIDEASVIQMLAPVLDEPACAAALQDGGHIRLNASDLHHLIKRAAEQEREACAQLCEHYGSTFYAMKAIRSRNKEKT